MSFKCVHNNNGCIELSVSTDDMFSGGTLSHCTYTHCQYLLMTCLVEGLLAIAPIPTVSIY